MDTKYKRGRYTTIQFDRWKMEHRNAMKQIAQNNKPKTFWDGYWKGITLGYLVAFWLVILVDWPLHLLPNTSWLYITLVIASTALLAETARRIQEWNDDINSPI